MNSDRNERQTEWTHEPNERRTQNSERMKSALAHTKKLGNIPTMVWQLRVLVIGIMIIITIIIVIIIIISSSSSSSNLWFLHIRS